MIDTGLLLVLLCFAAVVVFVGALISAIGEFANGWPKHKVLAGVVAGVLGTLIIQIILALAYLVGSIHG